MKQFPSVHRHPFPVVPHGVRRFDCILSGNYLDEYARKKISGARLFKADAKMLISCMYMSRILAPQVSWKNVGLRNRSIRPGIQSCDAVGVLLRHTQIIFSCSRDLRRYGNQLVLMDPSGETFPSDNAIVYETDERNFTDSVTEGATLQFSDEPLFFGLKNTLPAGGGIDHGAIGFCLNVANIATRDRSGTAAELGGNMAIPFSIPWRHGVSVR